MNRNIVLLNDLTLDENSLLKENIIKITTKIKKIAEENNNYILNLALDFLLRSYISTIYFNDNDNFKILLNLKEIKNFLKYKNNKYIFINDLLDNFSSNTLNPKEFIEKYLSDNINQKTYDIIKKI